jgi:hypothetical protein
VRVLNPTDGTLDADLRLGVPFAVAAAVRLDEEPGPFPIERSGQSVRFSVPPHALRSVSFRP